MNLALVFPPLDGAGKKTKIKLWKVVPVCLRDPRDSVKRGTLGQLCEMGLGSKWFTSEDRLEIADYLSAEELHFLIVCLYPSLPPTTRKTLRVL